MSKYPTREEILAYADLLTNDDITLLNCWRTAFYSDYKSADSIGKTEMLLAIADMLLGENEQVSVMFGDKYCFRPSDRLIILDHHNPSIISTLHEIGHAKFGPNELKACAWSVQLFKEVFPKAYAKLEWHGHMLKKPKSAPSGKGKSHGLKQT